MKITALLLAVAMLAIGADAGVVKIASAPARHPKKTTHAVGHSAASAAKVASYPFRHPAKTLEGATAGAVYVLSTVGRAAY